MTPVAGAPGRSRGTGPALLRCLLIVLALLPAPLRAEDGARAAADPPPASISGNPGAVDVSPGTGFLGRLLGIDPDSGVRLGGLWIGDANDLITGGDKRDETSFNSLLLTDLELDLGKLAGIPGAKLGAAFLQFNGQPTNGEAGIVTGFNGLPGHPPLVRSELYELWWRQSLLADRLIIRVGKTSPTYDFNNVARPVATSDESLAIPAVTGLVYTPAFVNPTILGVLPGYYNSAYGVTTTVAPAEDWYLSYGLYDGNLARGEQTGLSATPHFTGYYFHIAELGHAWLLGSGRHPGQLGLGAWDQTGQLAIPGTRVTENGAQGVYTFGSQRLWSRNPGVDNSGVSGFAQVGINDSRTMLAHRYLGLGLTGFGLVPGRPADSLGAGLAWSWLNRDYGFRNQETLLSVYYQMNVIGDFYLQPILTYAPNPGQSPSRRPATAVTIRATLLF